MFRSESETMRIRNKCHDNLMDLTGHLVDVGLSKSPLGPLDNYCVDLYKHRVILVNREGPVRLDVYKKGLFGFTGKQLGSIEIRYPWLIGTKPTIIPYLTDGQPLDKIFEFPNYDTIERCLDMIAPKWFPTY